MLPSATARVIRTELELSVMRNSPMLQWSLVNYDKLCAIYVSKYASENLAVHNTK
jgi:hypothetical protein